MTTAIVLQRFARVSMLGVDIEARTDLADEPVFEAGALGILLEHKESKQCRRLVRQLMDDGSLSWRWGFRTPTDNSADNSTFVETDQREPDVFVVEQHGQVGAIVRTTEQLWLTERACLIVAGESNTPRARRVRIALVDFFLEARRQRLSSSQTMLDEARAIRADVVHKLDLDARLRALEQRRRTSKSITPTDTLGAVIRRVLADHPKGLTASELLDIARTDIDAARGRRTLPMPLGKELAQLEGIERRWRHGHVSVWALRYTADVKHTDS